MRHTLWLASLLALLLAACGPQQPAAPAGEGTTAASTDVAGAPAASEAAPGTASDGTAQAQGPTPTINPTSVAIAQDFEVPMRGNADAQVRIYEFSDFLCPYCGNFARGTAAEVRKKYGPDEVAFIHWDFPLQSHGIMSMISAEAAHCAEEQKAGSYWAMNDIMFEKQAEMEEVKPDDEPGAVAKAVGLARSAGLDGDAMRSCLESQTFRPIVGALQQQALERGVEMTPTLVVVSRNPKTGEYGEPETVLGALAMAEFEPYITRSISRSMGTAVPTPTSPPTNTPAPVTPAPATTTP